MSEYWRARLDWHAALSISQQYGIADSASFPSAENETRFGLVDTWREAVAKQLLTPAPDLGAVTWKRAKLKSSDFSHLPLEAPRIEHAIADDLAFLAAHPTRRSNSEAMARSREFKDAMRRRIKDIAASRDIPDDEIRPVLSLKHRHIGEFATKYSVNLGWLLEGKGRIFKKDQQDLAAVVATMPEADQQAIRATVSEILQERDQ